MKTIAINAEYNPLHAGHRWQLEEVRKRAGADVVLVLMSGDFVQRGEPAIFDKYTRAAMALEAGADLVLELPVAAATGSAQRFAQGCIAILNALRGIDELWFGSEAGEIGPLLSLAEILAEEPAEYQARLRENLRAGMSFPAAREKALGDYNGGGGCSGSGAPITATPNNILALEYCQALIQTTSPITPRTHERVDVPSATEHRRDLLAKNTENALCADDFSSELRYQLLREDEQSLTQYLDVPADLARRIIKHMHAFESFTQFAEVLDTRDRTRTACMRALLHILLGITNEDFEAALSPAFVRMLAKGDAEDFLAANKAAGGIPVIANPAGAFEDAYARDLFASQLYENVLSARTGRPPVHEYSRKLLLH